MEIVKQLKVPKDIREEILKEKVLPHKKLSNFENILKMVKEISISKVDGFTIDELKEKAVYLGLTDEEIEDIMNKLLNEGYIYQKTIGHFKLI
ncbi:MAG: hypothetical protein ACTSPY_08235 [Candidatus Helarchaeota archaeon]